ncbi:MAG: endonuclease domain-containing protein [Patescibacteria group bacterium]|nr:endonuclease domain-containing protein [Patescibacteria group bacterium]
MSIYNRSASKPQRRRLRKNFTDAERLLWGKLRNRQVLGMKFFRQYGVGPYILDFYTPARRLAIEIDGGQHGETTQVKYDRQRTEYLGKFTIAVIRFQNSDVMKNIDGVIEQIVSALTVNPSYPPLAPRGGTNSSQS